jgi:hypothetical protein
MWYVASDQSSDSNEHEDLSSFVESAGYVLGAASCCTDIEHPRALIAADRISEIVEASGADTTAAQACDAAFREGLAAGAKAVRSGELDHNEIGAALASLEQVIGR